MGITAVLSDFKIIIQTVLYIVIVILGFLASVPVGKTSVSIFIASNKHDEF